MRFDKEEEVFADRFFKLTGEIEKTVKSVGLTAEVDQYCDKKGFGGLKCFASVVIYGGEDKVMGVVVRNEVGRVTVSCQPSEGICEYRIIIDGIPRDVAEIEDKLPEKIREKCGLKEVHLHGHEAYLHVNCEDIELNEIEDVIIELAKWNKKYAV